MLKPYYEDEIKIGIVACNKNMNLKISHLQEYLVEVGMNHCEQMNLGFFDLKKTNHIWVVADVEIHFNRNPKYNEKIKIKTWPIMSRIIVSERNYEVTDESREVVCYALSSWCILDSKSRRPVKLCDVVHKKPELYLDSIYEKSKFQFCEKENLVKIGDGEVVLSDLDANNHMNNTKYIDKILNTLSASEYENFSPKTVHLKFIKEATLGMKFDVLRFKNNNEWYFELRDKTNGDVLFEMIAIF